MPSQLTIIQQNDTHDCRLHTESFWSSSEPYYRKAGEFARAARFVQTL
jgi:hypothetical protein